MKYFVYIVRCSDDTLYAGITTDLNKRIDQHNRGIGAKYTKGRSPIKLEYFEEVEGRSDATKREMEIKRLSRKEKFELFTGFQPIFKKD